MGGGEHQGLLLVWGDPEDLSHELLQHLVTLLKHNAHPVLDGECLALDESQDPESEISSRNAARKTSVKKENKLIYYLYTAHQPAQFTS